jgi:cytochrome P450
MAQPAGPKLPAVLQMLLWIARPIELMLHCRERYGDVFVLRMGPYGHVVLVSRPELIREIFTGDPAQLRAGEVNAIVGPLVGEHSVLLLDGPSHLRHRKMMLPPFHGERMRLYASTMQEITERAVAGFPEGEVFPLHPHAQHITLEVILRTVFGVDEADRLRDLSARLRRLLAIADSRLSLLSMIPAFRVELPLLPFRRFMRRRRRADELIYREIARRRAQSGSDRTDVLALLLAARDEDGEPLDDVELRDELMTLLVAGHETTATALCWAFERVLATPQVLDRIHAELDEVCAGEPLRPEHIGRLDYLEATITEALRLRPVLPLVGRHLHAPLRLGEWEIPEGWVVAPCIYLAHRHASVYENPEAFLPERFLNKRPDPYAWLPFGGGIRRCLGMAFALYEMKVVMATILSQVELELAQRAPVSMVRRAITFTPRGGTKVRVLGRRRRQKPSATTESSARI